MIEISGLNKSFGRVKALKGVGFTISPGKITVIAGPNGSGKTTLIKTILGLVRPDKGVIRLDGEILNGDHSYRRQIGYMPQVGQFPENLRVSEVLDLLVSVRAQALRGKQRLVSILGLNSVMRKKVGVLSGGTRQKLNALIAFLFQPQILILDEPTGGLDPASSGILKEEIRMVRDDGNTVVLSTHIMSEIEELADTIVYLFDGKVVFTGSKSDLLNETGMTGVEGAFGELIERNGT